MKDLDFDELDRAVNSLMSGNSNQTPAKKTDDSEKTLTINPTLSNDAKVPFDKLGQTANQAGRQLDRPAATTSSPPPARRASGRFMDVVHPSSDMKKADAPTVSREGRSLSPPSSRATSTSGTPADPTPAASASSPSPSSPTSPVTPPVTSEPAPNQSSDWPDPIALQDFDKEATTPGNDSEASPATTPPDDTVAAKPAASPAPATASNPDETLDTPFLSDTKVEKRPLGAFATPTDVAIPTPESETPAAADVDATAQEKSQAAKAENQLAADPTDTLAEAKPDLPDELHSELMKVESAPVQTTESAPATPTQSTATARVTPAPEPTGPASITQQYREEPSTGDDQHAAIYDTDSYHEPLKHPEKTKSGWLWVLWIILLLAVGSGGAAVLYFSGII